MWTRSFSCAVLAVAAAFLCSAQTALSQQQAFAGTWVMHLGARTLLVLSLHVEPDHVEGTLDRPAHMASEGNTIFSNLCGGIRHDFIRDSHEDGPSLRFQMTDLTDTSTTTRYVLTVDGDSATLTEADGPPVTPLHLQRVPAPTTVSTDWELNRTYSLDDTDKNNPAMKALFDEDQRVRMVQPIDWKVVSKSDEQRRTATRKLLTDGSLHTGTDYENAAFIFQHGATADDYLLAHTLAVVAISKGDADAIWIATATLDRYLQSIGQKQIYGTQYRNMTDHSWTQEPFNKTLISDSLREQLGTQPQNIDDARLKFLSTQGQASQSK